MPIPMVLKNGISEADAKTFAVRATDGVNRTLGMLAVSAGTRGTIYLGACTYFVSVAAYACRLASGKEVFLSLQVYLKKVLTCCFTLTLQYVPKICMFFHCLGCSCTVCDCQVWQLVHDHRTTLHR